MRKTSINILCIIILLILGASTLAPAYYLGRSFGAGFKAGYNAAENDTQTEYDSFERIDAGSCIDLSFNPKIETMISMNDSITFENGNSYPIVLMRASVFVPADKTLGAVTILMICLYICIIVLFILVMIEFIRFIININKGIIFDIKNVKRLNHISIYLISLACLKIIAGLVDDTLLARFALSLKGYDISSYWTIPWDSFLFGFLALLMAKIWEGGLKMKREQELTI